MAVMEGVEAPQFQLAASNGRTWSLEEQRGRWVAVYFYPKDDTPGCTREACSFRDNHKPIEAQNAVVVGVSPDDLRSHDRFITKHALPFLLLADTDHKVAELYAKAL